MKFLAQEGECCCLASSTYCICVFPCLNVQEEEEKRLEEIFEADIDNTFEDKHIPKEELPEEGAVALAGKRTLETLTATDSIIDSLDVAEVELKRIAEHEVFSTYLVHLF